LADEVEADGKRWRGERRGEKRRRGREGRAREK
jgi:hypothetical protein